MEEVTARNPHAGEFFFTLAVQLEARNKQPEARQYFLQAIEKMPRLLGPRSHLGLLAMRAGEETEARRWLKEAFQADPFNVRVKNTLEVLDVLEAMQTTETEHVVIRNDAQRDGLLARYAAKYLDEVYPEWCRRFGYQPPEKPLVEIFNRARGLDGHQWFSARMTGLPYLGTVAACTGRVVALVSPGAQTGRQFNWARVLRHELVHVVTLQQTHFNIPHWFTEGLAVSSEDGPRPQVWNELLMQRVPAGYVFHLDTLNFGFTRPHTSGDWHMAYCQAELYVEYMLARAGEPSLGKMLAAYAEGLETPAAIRRVFGVSQKEFEAGYTAYLKEQVGKMSQLEPVNPASFADLLKAQREQPDDADAAADLACAYLRRQADPEALDMARRAMKLKPKHQLAAYVLARLELKAGRTRAAVDLLEECLDPKSPQPNALNLLAGLRLKAEQYDEAERLYTLGQRLDSVNLGWTSGLARLYLLSENRPKLVETLARLARADSDDLAVRQKLAEMALKGQDYAAAADWANQALQIDVMDADVHRVLAEAAAGLHNYAQAIEEFEVAIELRPDEPQQRFALADICVQAHEPAKARRVLEELLRRVPDYPGAEVLLESLRESKPDGTQKEKR